jgi:hypothetical protein
VGTPIRLTWLPIFTLTALVIPTQFLQWGQGFERFCSYLDHLNNPVPVQIQARDPTWLVLISTAGAIFRPIFFNSKLDPRR